MDSSEIKSKLKIGFKFLKLLKNPSKASLLKLYILYRCTNLCVLLHNVYFSSRTFFYRESI